MYRQSSFPKAFPCFPRGKLTCKCGFGPFSLHFVRPSHNSPIGSGIFCSSPEQNVDLTTSVSGPNPLSKRLPFLLFASTRLSGTTFCTDIRTTNDIDEMKVIDRIEGREISIKPRREPFREDNGAQTTLGRGCDGGCGIRRTDRRYESRYA